MLADNIAQKMKLARYKILEDGSYFGEIAGLRGVWASEGNSRACRHALQEVLEDWLII